VTVNPTTAHFKRCECGGQFYCTDSRTSYAGGIPHLRRRYRCAQCEKRITTAELVMPNHEGGTKGILAKFLQQFEGQQMAELKERLRELL